MFFLWKHFWIIPWFHISQSQHQQQEASQSFIPQIQWCWGHSNTLPHSHYFSLLKPSWVLVRAHSLSFTCRWSLEWNRKTHIVEEVHPSVPILGLQISTVICIFSSQLPPPYILTHEHFNSPLRGIWKHKARQHYSILSPFLQPSGFLAESSSRNQCFLFLSSSPGQRCMSLVPWMKPNLKTISLMMHSGNFSFNLVPGTRKIKVCNHLLHSRH